MFRRFRPGDGDDPALLHDASPPSKDDPMLMVPGSMRDGPPGCDDSDDFGIGGGPSPKRHRSFYGGDAEGVDGEENNAPPVDDGGFVDHRHFDHPDQSGFDDGFDHYGGGTMIIYILSNPFGRPNF